MLKRFTGIGIIVGCFVIIGVAAPVLAQSDNAPDRPVSSQNGDGRSGSAGTPAMGQDIADRARDRATQIREQAQERAAQLRADVCDRREQQLSQLIPNLSRQATSLLGAMDTVYGRVQTFYEAGQLTADDYDGLKANVNTAQTEASAATQTLQEYEFDLNCDEPNAGSQLDTFRIAANEARESLKTYRAELVNLISAMRAAAAENAEASEEQL